MPISFAQSATQQSSAQSHVVAKPRARVRTERPTAGTRELERILSAPIGEFEKAGRGAHHVKTFLSLDFGKPVVGTAGMKKRDAKMDAVARIVVDTLSARGGRWKASAIGASEEKRELVAGLMREKYGSSLQDFAEAYNILDVRAPILKDQSMALVRMRRFNEFKLNNRPAKYVDEKAVTMLAFIDPKTRQLYGSGFHLDDGSAQEIADAIVSHLDNMVELNRGRH